MSAILSISVYQTKHSFCPTFLGPFSDSCELDYAKSQILAGFRISDSSLHFPQISSPNKRKVVFK
ncbi:hypothetical protein LEP1GSC132_4504 [Leptospira kirschneri str. 200803703]|nr:hypothetical protein LEP1GSC132_4504 [Leptospira kirschneri str. 200803703]